MRRETGELESGRKQRRGSERSKGDSVVEKEYTTNRQTAGTRNRGI